MAPSGSSSTSGQEAPSNEGAAYGSESLTANNEEQIAIVEETSSVLLVAHPTNSGTVFVGWDSDVSTANGVPLQAGTSISFDLDANQQSIHVVGDTDGDEVRYIATG